MGPAINRELPCNCLGWYTAFSSDGTILSIAVGAPSFPLDADNEPGHVTVSRRDRKVWFPLGAAIEAAEDGDLFVHSVALSSDSVTLVIGIGALGCVGGFERPGYIWVYTSWKSTKRSVCGASRH